MDQNPPIPFLEWPSATPETVAWLLVAFAGLIMAVALWDWRRRRQDLAERLKAEWLAVHEIAREKDLAVDEWSALQTLIHAYSAAEPLRAVTVRQHFDECISAAMSEIWSQGDLAQYERQGQALRDIRLRLGLDVVPFGQCIVSTRELFAGQVIWMVPATEEPPQWRRATIVEVDEALFRVTPAAEMVDWAPGTVVRCRLWRQEDARYLFEVPLARIEPSPPAWLFRHTSELERRQSRAFYRVVHNQAAVVGVLNAPVDGDEATAKDRRVVTQFRGRVTSVSAGGIALMLPQPVPQQVLLRIALELPGLDPLTIESRVVSATAVSGNRWFVRASFVGIEETTRDRIARYVLHRQQPLLNTESKPV